MLLVLLGLALLAGVVSCAWITYMDFRSGQARVFWISGMFFRRAEKPRLFWFMCALNVLQLSVVGFGAVMLFTLGHGTRQ